MTGRMDQERRFGPVYDSARRRTERLAVHLYGSGVIQPSARAQPPGRSFSPSATFCPLARFVAQFSLRFDDSIMRGVGPGDRIVGRDGRLPEVRAASIQAPYNPAAALANKYCWTPID